jgi:DNA-directed RNA polymerase specialized sigma24 family protein
MPIPENMIIDREKKLLNNNKLIKKMVSDLSPEGRFILASREIENLSFKEIALITGKKADELRKYFSQLKDELQKQLINDRSSPK